MVMAKINLTKPKMPTAPLPQAPAKPESALPDVQQNDGAKYKPELDNSAILENRGKKLPNITGRLELPDGILPKPGLHIDTNAIKDAFTVAKADGNHDGKLNADEFKKTENIFEQFTDKDKFNRYDKDNDGYVTGKEYHDGAQGDRFREAVGHLHWGDAKPPADGKPELHTLEHRFTDKPADDSVAVPISAQVKAE